MLGGAHNAVKTRDVVANLHMWLAPSVVVAVVAQLLRGGRLAGITALLDWSGREDDDRGARMSSLEAIRDRHGLDHKG